VEIFRPGLRGRTIMGTVLSCIALIATWGCVQQIPPWIDGVTGDQGLKSTAQMLGGFGAVIGCIAGALVGQQMGRRWAYFTLCLTSLLACAFLFGFLVPETGAAFLVAVFLVGGVTAAFYGWLPLYLPELFPTRLRATGQGFGYNFGRIITAGGLLGFGYLMSVTGDYAWACLTISLIYLVGMVVVWFAPETHGRPLPE
jgi:MFS family permease